MISVQFTIAGAPYENIKVRVEAENEGELTFNLELIQSRARDFFVAYEKLIAVRDMGHQEAVEAVVQGLGAVVVEEDPLPTEGLTGDPSKPFWEDNKPNPLAEVFADKKPWERKQSGPEPAAPAAGQSVNLL